MSLATETIRVPDIACAHCKGAIEGALRPLEGVAQARVDVAARTVAVTYDATRTPRRALLEAIEGQGYTVPPAP